MNAREETLYRRALRLNRYVQSRWRRETTAAERERTVHAHAVARRIRRDAARLSAARAIDRLEHALEQLEADHPAREHVAIGLHALTGCDPPPTAYEAYATGESRRPARLRALASIASALDHADDMPAGARVDIEAARVALIAQERRAIPIETVAEYVVEEMTRAEAAYEHGRAEYSPVPGARERADWCRYVHRELCKTEEHGVGAVLGVDLGEALLEQLALIGEQLYWQEQIGTVPRILTEFAVQPPFRRDDGTPSADRAAWIRQKIGRRE